MRQYGEVPPTLSTAAAPSVSTTTGLGTGGGASVQTKGLPSDGQGFGDVVVMSGSNPSSSGSVVLTFPQTPPILFFAADEGFGALTVTGNDGAHTSITVAWSVTLPKSRRLGIHYEWNVSQ